MSLKNLNNLKTFYRSPEDDISNNFYLPCMKESITFNRSAGFFSLYGLCDYFEGIIDILKRNGQIKILTSPNLSEKEMALLKNAIDKESIVVNSILETIDEQKIYIEDEKLEFLSALIVNNAIEIKIVYKNEGLYHEKCGYFSDSDGNSIWFIGSDNESKSAHFSNTELTFVSKSWENEKEFNELKTLFTNAWLGYVDDAITLDLPEAIKKELIGNYTKCDIETAIIKYETALKKNKKQKNLYEHQKKAIEYFTNNNCNGFLEMATGTGKTFTSCKIIEKTLVEKKPFIMILVPQSDLQIQWNNELESLGIKTYMFGGYGSSGNSISGDFLVAKTDYMIEEPGVCISTYSTFFEKLVDEFSQINNSFIVVDEAHNLSANQFDKLPKSKYRLGLSATPIKHDEILSNKIVEYFTNGVETYKYTIEDAINNGFLSHYNYYPIYVELNNTDFTEFDDFCSLTTQIASLLNTKPLDKETKEKIEKKANDRSLIVKKAVNKKIKLEELLLNQDIYPFKKAVVYCGAGKDTEFSNEDRLIDSITKTLHKYNITCCQFTSNTPDRQVVLDFFKKGYYDVLVAMRCFDEGVDVPQLERIYIMSSERLLRQTIQRRGRVLRKCKESGKTIGYIYDFVVLPPKGYEDKTGSKSLIKIEFERVHEYIKLADNKDKYETEIKEIENMYGLEWNEEERNYGGKEFNDIDEE